MRTVACLCVHTASIDLSVSMVLVLVCSLPPRFQCWREILPSVSLSESIASVTRVSFCIRRQCWCEVPSLRGGAVPLQELGASRREHNHCWREMPQLHGGVVPVESLRAPRTETLSLLPRNASVAPRFCPCPQAYELPDEEFIDICCKFLHCAEVLLQPEYDEPPDEDRSITVGGKCFSWRKGCSSPRITCTLTETSSLLAPNASSCCRLASQGWPKTAMQGADLSVSQARSSVWLITQSSRDKYFWLRQVFCVSTHKIAESVSVDMVSLHGLVARNSARDHGMSESRAFRWIAVSYKELRDGSSIKAQLRRTREWGAEHADGSESERE